MRRRLDAGNFGTLKFPRTDVPTANDIPANMANGLQLPLTAEVHPGRWPTRSGRPVHQRPQRRDRSRRERNLRAGTNCVDTDTGLAANVATEGLVQGGATGQGCSRTQNTRTGRDPQGGSYNRTLTFGSTSYSVNDDVLSCYFIDGTTSIADISKAQYSGGIAFIPHLPEVAAVLLRAGPGDPTDHRRFADLLDHRLPPAFITDETATATAIKGSNTGTRNNGLYVQGNDIKQLKVVFFNDGALPERGRHPAHRLPRHREVG